jgi:hypothetical protein
MRGETQALLLEKLMQNKKVHPEYELSLPFFKLKKTDFKRLSKADILLLGLDKIKLILVYSDLKYANVELIKDKNILELEVISIDKTLMLPSLKSKYEIVKSSLAILSIEQLDIGVRLDVSKIDFENVRLVVNGSNRQIEGKLVEVEGEIAIEIKKVYDA